MMFPKEVYQERRKVLTEKLSKGIAFFPGNEESPMNYRANTYPFRQDSNFLYYFGIDRPGLHAAIDLETGESYLFGEDLTLDDIVWMGLHPTLQEFADHSGISHIKNPADLDKAWQGRDIHILPYYRPEHRNPIKRIDPEVKRITEPSEEFIRAVISQRSYKDPAEIAEMERALEVTTVMHIEAMKASQKGKKEAHLAGIAGGIAKAAGCLTAYPIILTVDGHILHNHYYGNSLKEGQMVLADMGAESRMHYASDITRTFPVGLKFDDRQRAIYDIVLKTQETACDMVKPGVKFKDIHLEAARIITEGLKDLGLMQGDAKEAVEAGAHALFFPHGLGHMIGLDVHDMEGLGEDYVGYNEDVKRSDQFGLAYLRMARALEPGMVVTVEPGVYFIPALIDQWRAEKKFDNFISYEKLKDYLDFGGVRIEDNVLVTEKGNRVLGPAIPKKVKEIEALSQ